MGQVSPCKLNQLLSEIKRNISKRIKNAGRNVDQIWRFHLQNILCHSKGSSTLLWTKLISLREQIQNSGRNVDQFGASQLQKGFASQIELGRNWKSLGESGVHVSLNHSGVCANVYILFHTYVNMTVNLSKDILNVHSRNKNYVFPAFAEVHIYIDIYIYICILYIYIYI